MSELDPSGQVLDFTDIAKFILSLGGDQNITWLDVLVWDLEDDVEIGQS